MPFIDLSNSHWREITTSFPADIYILPEYTRLESEVLHGRPIAWVITADGKPKALIPFIERIITRDSDIYLDLVSPYGYPGMSYGEDVTKEQYCDWLALFHKEAAASGYISSFIRLHPLYNNFQINKQSGITQHAHGSTISVNLSLPLHEIRQSYSQNHRRNIIRLHEEGYRVVVDRWTDIPQFIDLYTQTMQRKHAKPRYFFSNDYFLGLKQILRGNLMLIMVYTAGQRPAAGGLFSLTNGLAQFHLGGTEDAFIRRSPSKLMIDAAIAQLKERGGHTLHLGGGYGSSIQDGLFRFKAGFGSQRHSFSTLRFIHHRDIYYELLKANSHTQNDNNAFFPEYRLLST